MELEWKGALRLEIEHVWMINIFTLKEESINMPFDNSNNKRI